MKDLFNRFAALAMTLLLLGAAWHLPAFAASSVQDNGAKADVTIMGYNVLTTSKQDITAAIDPNSTLNRGQKLIAMLQSHFPDSIGLCEVTSEWLTYLKGDVVDADYGTARYAVVGTTPTNTTANSGKLCANTGEYSPILYRSDKYSLVEQGGYWFSATPNEPSKWGDITDSDGNVIYTGMQFNRVMSYVVLQDKVTSGVYIHINVHTDHKCADYINRLCAKQLVDTAKELSAQYGNCPVVMTGDYNAAETTETYAYLSDTDNGFANAKYITDNRSYASSCAGYGGDFKEYYTTVIDHVFVSNGNVGVYEHEILEDRYASDHSAVKVRLRLNDMPILNSAIYNNNAVYGFDANTYSYDITAESESVTLKLNTNSENIIYVNDVLQSMDDSGNCEMSLQLEDGSNVYKVCVVNAAGARTEYCFDIYRNYGDPVVVISEINPNSNSPYFSVTNLGDCNVALTDYRFLWGDIQENGTSTWESEFQIDWNRTEITNINVGQTLVFWVTNSNDPEEFNEVYGTFLSEEDLVYGSLSMDTNGERGMRIADQSGNTISVSSYYNGAEPVNGALYKFGYVESQVATTTSELENAKYATPEVYERYVGGNYRDAFSDMEAEEKDNSVILGTEYTIITNDADDNMNINATTAGSWVFYANVDFGDSEYGAYRAILYGACRESNCGGVVEIWIDGTKEGDLTDAVLVGTVNTYGSQDNWLLFRNYECQLNQLVTGVHNVTLVMKPTLTHTINLDYFTFEDYVPGTDIDTIESVDCTIDGATITDGIELIAIREDNKFQMNTNVECSPSNAAISIGYLSSNEDVATINFETGEITCVGTGDVIITVVVYSNLEEFERYTYNVSFVYSTNAYGYIEGEWATDLTEGVNYQGTPTLPAIQYSSGATGMSSYVTPDTKNYLGGTVDGATVTYENINFGEGGYTSVVCNMALRTDRCDGIVNIYIKNDDDTLTQIGYCNANEGTGSDYNTYVPFTGVITDTSITGIHDVVLGFDANYENTTYTIRYVGNLDYFQFISPDIEANRVAALINAIDSEVTLLSEPAIAAAREAYDALSQKAQSLVENYATLTAAEAALAVLKAEGEADALDAFQYVEAERYTETTGDTVAKYANTTSVTGISSYMYNEKNYLGATKDGNTAAYVIDFGNAGISGVQFNMAVKTSNCAGTIKIFVQDASENRTQIGYCNISEGTDNGDNNYNTYLLVDGVITEQNVTGIQNVVLEFEVADGMSYVGNIDYFIFIEKDIAVVNVENMIDAIGEVTLSSESAIVAAREAYEALTEEQQTKVGNYADLTDAEGALAALKQGNGDSAINAYSKIEGELWTEVTAGTTKTPDNKNAENGVNMSEHVLSNGDKTLGDTVDGATATYVVDFGNGGYNGVQFNMALRTGRCSGTVRIYVKEANGALNEIGYVTLTQGDATGSDYNTYQMFDGVITDRTVSGIQNVVLEFVVDSGMSYVGNIDYFTFTALDAFDKIEAELSHNVTGYAVIKTTDTSPGEYTGLSDYVSADGMNYLGGTKSNSTASYLVDFGSGGMSGVVFNFAVKASNCAGTVDIFVRNVDDTLRKIGYCDISQSTGSAYFVYEEFTGVITDTAVTGVQEVVLTFTSTLTYVGNMDYFQFITEDSVAA